MIRKAIKEEIERRGIPVRQLVIQSLSLNDYSNFTNYLNGVILTFPLEKIEKVLEYLELEITPKKI